jgi:hypothetical protein
MTTQTGRLSRRSLLRLSATAALAILGAGRGSQTSRSRLLATRLRSLLPHDAAAVALGTRYLVQTPSEASPERLVAALAAGRRGGVMAGLGHRRLGALLARRIRSDFAAGRTVAVHGWIVSLTEARLAALVVIG